MWTQHWPLGELQSTDKETGKLISENGGTNPLSSTAVLYLPIATGVRGLKSVERENKLIKINATKKQYENPDPIMTSVRIFEEKVCEKGFSSLEKDAHKVAEELGTSLNLATPDPSCSSQQAPNKRIRRYQLRQHLKKAEEEKLKEKKEHQRWQGRLLWTRWEDDQLSADGCFAWLSGWACALTHTITGVIELYEQLLPTRVYAAYKTGTLDQILKHHVQNVR